MGKMKLKTYSFARCHQGSVAVIAALVMSVLVIGAGVAVDYSTAVGKRKNLQAVADSAAIGAAREMSLANATVVQIETVAQRMVALKLDAATAGLQVTVTVDEGAASVVVALQETWAPYFMGLISSTSKSVNASAKAQIAGTGKICVLGLDGTSNRTIHLKRSALLTANDCGVYSNSTSSDSIRIENNAQMAGSLICSAGGAYGTPSAYSPFATTDCPPLSDPLIDRSPPTVGLCDYNGYEAVGASVTLTPGVYCGGLVAASTTVVTFEPGIYIIKDGPLEAQAKSTFQGTNVGFYFIGIDTEIRFGGQTTISLTAPRDGDLAGILFYEDRTNPAGLVHRITSNDARLLLGTFYLPNSTLFIDANAPVADQSAYTAVVARKLTLDAGPNLVLNSDYGATDIPVPGALSGVGGRIVLAE